MPAPDPIEVASWMQPAITYRNELLQQGADDEYEASAAWLETHISSACASAYRAARRPPVLADSSDSADAERLRWLLQHCGNELAQVISLPVTEPTEPTDDLGGVGRLNQARQAIDLQIAAGLGVVVEQGEDLVDEVTEESNG